MTKQGILLHSLAVLVCILISPQSAFSREVIVDFDSQLLSSKQQAVLSQWLNYGLHAVANTLGPISQKSVPIKVTVTSASEPVPWGQVVRGKIDGIEMRIGQFNHLEELKSDWTLYHELSHLYHPLFAYRDFWLAEGLATYFQNIVMLQNAIYSQEEFVARMRAGLERGKAATRTHIGRLDKVSLNMWRLRAYQRVYWTGAAFFIEADALLKKSGSRYNVAQLLAQYQTCCRAKESEGASYSAREFVTRLDSLSGKKIFLPLYERYRTTKHFPEIDDEQLALLINVYPQIG
ncbi:hypothetical protein J8M20_16660 [Pseudoalteromonas luteoviolacea]|uniref:M61 family metallopeptidase n=1 Tax=Pseudoalteromonas luteoviolacea TaxID=43657 RepID=UPI001B392CB5|nr:hypothetical protein [Pseudoalteromonas luteoviolacea]MBQ4812995.1 hypothetical protein [Pseudoalteromonas luteoviolacea]